MDGTRAHGRGHPRERVLVLAVRPDALKIGRPTPEPRRRLAVVIETGGQTRRRPKEGSDDPLFSRRRNRALFAPAHLNAIGNRFGAGHQNFTRRMVVQTEERRAIAVKLFVRKVLVSMTACGLFVFSSACFVPFRQGISSATEAGTHATQSPPADSESRAPEAQISIQTIKPGVLTVGISPGMKPYSFYEAGQLTGFDLDLAAAVSQRLELELKIVTMDFEDLFSACEKKQVDCVMGMEYSDIRAEALYFVSYMAETVNDEKFDIGLYTNSSNLADTLSSIFEAFAYNGQHSALVEKYFSSDVVA